ncbi:MAG: hypothetical protein IT429_06405 [Gemmataceae bacterium]|nr:hypothetical protein [Gemmataceae bacterium]
MIRAADTSAGSRWTILRHLAHVDSPLLGLGMTSLVLGIIGMLLFFLPVLGIPLSACGLAFGVIGFGMALFTGGPALRWSLSGVAASALALGVNVVLNAAPEGYLPQPSVPPPWQLPSDRPFVAPPAARHRETSTTWIVAECCRGDDLSGDPQSES